MEWNKHQNITTVNWEHNFLCIPMFITDKLVKRLSNPQGQKVQLNKTVHQITCNTQIIFKADIPNLVS